MSPDTESLLAVVAVVLLTGVALAVPVMPASAQAGNESTTAETPTTITVSASGQASSEPSRAIIRVESAATAASPSNATERLAVNTSRLRSALTEAGIESGQLRTIYYSLDEVRPRTTIPGPPEDPREPEKLGYRARQGFEIEVSNVSRVGEIVDVAVDNGATSVLGVEFTLSERDQDELQQQALQTAMKNARTQAETLAATESLSISGVQSISTEQQFFGPTRTYESDETGTIIDGAPVTVEVRVTVVYEAE